MPNIPVKNCCGCAACENACSAFAIKMQPDSVKPLGYALKKH